MILRDADLSEDWDEPSDGLDTRHYYCQNWRADVSVILNDSGHICERVIYSPYGVPFGIPAGDLVTSSSLAQPADGIVDGADSAVLIGAYSGSWNYCDLDNDGDVDASDLAVLNNNWANTLGWGLMSNHHNRLGYAGYVFDEALAGTKWHVRHRVLESVLGRWLSRDPLGYVDGMGLFNLLNNNALIGRDPFGICNYCGPDITDWLAGAMKVNCRSLGYWWTDGNLGKWLGKVANHGAWDYKRAKFSASCLIGEWEPEVVECPSGECNNAIGLCGQCLRRAAVGNLNYSYTGRCIGLSLDELLIGSLLEDPKGTEDACDRAAIRAGFRLGRSPLEAAIMGWDENVCSILASEGVFAACKIPCVPCPCSEFVVEF